jgi:protein-tyrosine phosphatase
MKARRATLQNPEAPGWYNPARMRILFVCSGNICRSPLAEALFVHAVRAAGLEDQFEVDSAGTHDFHAGDRADPRTIQVGASHGIDVTSIARKVRGSDFDRFDLILGMDRGHLRELRSMAPGRDRDKIELMRSYDEPGADPDVADPYYGGIEGFERMYQVLLRCSANLLAALQARLAQPAAQGAEPA